MAIFVKHTGHNPGLFWIYPDRPDKSEGRKPALIITCPSVVYQFASTDEERRFAARQWFRHTYVWSRDGRDIGLAWINQE